MPANRFFSTTDQIEGEEFHHLKKVMRKNTGDTIEVVNGKGHLIQARITETDRHSAHFTPVKEDIIPPPSPLLYLAQPILKQSNLELVIEKGTEVGIDAFHFWGETPSSQKQARLSYLAIGALKQSGRLYLPPIHFYRTLQDVPFGNHPIVYADFDGATPSPMKEDMFIVMGREGGYTAEERCYLKEKGHSITLGENTLRAETAAICGCFLYLSRRRNQNLQ